jgi:homoserine O-acetyltransferase/O-succinyltransferase
LPMKLGGVLEAVDMAYESWGEPNGANTVLLFTGLSPSAHAASSPEDPEPGWWEDMIGPGRALDTGRFHVVCVNSLGSCFGSSGPASPDPATGRVYGTDFPELSLEDVALAARRLLDVLGIEHLHTVMGASMGGMSALAFARANPERFDNLSLISTAAVPSAYAIALRSLQREIVRSDPAWQKGAYPPGAGPGEGGCMGSKLGTTTYRAAEEWEQRFGHKRIDALRRRAVPFAMEFEVESYLEHQAQKFCDQFDANCYLYLSRAVDRFDLCEDGCDVTELFAGAAPRHVQIIGVHTDTLFPPSQQAWLSEAFGRAGAQVDVRVLDCLQGHDAFLVDTEQFGRIIGEFFAAL